MAVNVLSELEAVKVTPVFFRQVSKLSAENWNVPDEQEVSEVLMVIVVLSIISEKVTDVLKLWVTPVSESDGEELSTVGAVVSSL